MNNPIHYREAEPLLRIQNVGLTLNGQVILRDVNAEILDVIRDVDEVDRVNKVKQGQVIGFLGRSGIGKTQLFRILAGLQKPTTGQVLLGEQGIPVERGMVGVVAQNYILFDKRTILSNLMIAATQAGDTKKLAKERAMTMLERFKLTDKANAYPKQLSGGQRQRIAIAQQILCNSHYLLMDEPFSGLDLVMKGKVSELIQEIAHMDEKNTIIVVTHDVSEASSVADELWLMGRDRDSDGNEIAGSRIKMTYDLKVRGLAWQPGITLTREFLDFTTEVKEKFLSL
jgi:polar amino acid transport system ATP-binding protein/sulfate transport system ATP-binding protein